MVGATFIVYVCLMMLIGYAAYLRTKNLSDYILDGRRLDSWVTALSACASDMSGWLLHSVQSRVWLGKSIISNEN